MPTVRPLCSSSIDPLSVRHNNWPSQSLTTTHNIWPFSLTSLTICRCRVCWQCSGRWFHILCNGTIGVQMYFTYPASARSIHSIRREWVSEYTPSTMAVISGFPRGPAVIPKSNQKAQFVFKSNIPYQHFIHHLTYPIQPPPTPFSIFLNIIICYLDIQQKTNRILQNWRPTHIMESYNQ